MDRKKYPPCHPTFIMDWQSVGTCLTHISANISGVWGLSANGQIFYRNGTYENNQSVGDCWWQVEGTLQHLSVGWNIVWGVDCWGKVWYREGIDSQHVTGTHWVNIPTDVGFRLISVDRLNRVWAVDFKNDVYFRVGSCIDQKAGMFWKKVDYLRLRHLDCSRCGVWVVDERGEVLCRMGTDTGFQGSHWAKVGPRTPPMTMVSAGGDRLVIGLGSDGQLYLREGMVASQPEGTHWRLLNGRLSTVNMYGYSVWGVDRSGQTVNSTCWPYPYPPSDTLRQAFD